MEDLTKIRKKNVDLTVQIFADKAYFNEHANLRHAIF